jgi:hypothetical protein
MLAFLAASDLLWIAVSPILLLLGIVGNAMSVVVLSRKEMMKATTTVYLITLSCVDTLVLYTGLLRNWLIRATKTDVRNLSNFGCKLHLFLVYASMQYSAWVLCLVAAERTVSVFLPHKYKALGTKRLALVLLSVVAFVIALVNQQFFWTYSLTEDVESVYGSRCLVKDRFKDFHNFVWPWIDFCLASLFPSLIMLVCNTSIVVKLFRVRKRNIGLETESTRLTSMNAILLTLCLVFLLSSAPICIYILSEKYWGAGVTRETGAKLSVVWAVVNLLYYCNNSINFLLYCVSGPRFRRVLGTLCKCNQVGPSPLAPPSGTAPGPFNNQVTPRQHHLKPSAALTLHIRRPAAVLPPIHDSPETMVSPLATNRTNAWM